MENGLPTVSTDIGHNTVAITLQAFLAGDLGDGEH
jgi:hypothetical protein